MTSLKKDVNKMEDTIYKIKNHFKLKTLNKRPKKIIYMANSNSRIF